MLNSGRARWGAARCGLASVLLLLPGVVNGQTTAQIPLQFDFMNPGARSLGMGGAFIGAADDATAAFANPAGLAFLTLREASAELRYRSVETRFLEGGRISGVVTGAGLDVVAGPVYATDVDRHITPAFLSFVLPLSHFTVTGYRHEAVRIENSFFSNGPFERATFAGITNDSNRELPIGGTRQVTIVNYGAAGGAKITEHLAVGGGISLYTFDLESNFARFSFVSNVFSPPDQHVVVATAVQQGDDVAVSANGGVTWVMAKGFKVGGQFRRGPRFQFTQHDVVPIDGLDLLRSGRFKVPDVAGVGFEWRPGDRQSCEPPPGESEPPHFWCAMRLLVDYDRVQYGQLKDDFITIQSLASGRESQLRIDDGNELHGGVEYVLASVRTSPALRAGAWFDPDHTVRYEPTAANDETDVLLRATLPGGPDLVHYTFGGGVALSRHFEVNGAADLSRRTTYLTVSGVVRF